MVDTTDPRLLELLAEVAHNTRSSTGTGTGSSSRSSYRSYGYKDIGLFGNAVRQATDGVKLMHGSVDSFVDTLSHFARNIAGLETIALLVKDAMELGKTYSKLSDIGQTFGGSMFEMARQAGASGLSLDEFSKMLEKNSTVSALMNEQAQGVTSDFNKALAQSGTTAATTAAITQQAQGATSDFSKALVQSGTTAAALSQHTEGSANALGALQLKVRDNLKDFGFYGMTLSQLTDTTSDYMESMRLSGQLGKRSSDEEAVAIKGMIGDVSAFSEATGKSRQEILKGIAGAARETSAAMRSAAHPLSAAQQDAYTKFTGFFSSLPGIAGEQLPKFFAQTYGTQNTWFTDMGKMFQKAGLPNINANMTHMVKQMESGVVPSVDEMVDSIIDQRDSILSQTDQLQARANAGNQDAAQALAYGQSLQGLNRNELIAKIKQQREMDKYTKDFMLFESNFHQLTGKFRDSFYASFSEMISGPKDISDEERKRNSDRWTASWDTLNKALTKLGGAFGTLLGEALSPEHLAYMGDELDKFSTWIANIAHDKEFQDKLIALKNLIIGLGNAVKWVIEKIHSMVSLIPGVQSHGLSGVATGLVTYGVYRFLKAQLSGLFSRIFAKNVVVYAQNMSGPGTGGGSGAGSGPGANPAARQTLRQAWKTGGWKSVISNTLGKGAAIRSVGGMVVGAVVGLTTDYFIQGLKAKVPDFTGKDAIFEYGGAAISVVAGLFAPALLTSLGTAITTAVGASGALAAVGAVALPALAVTGALLAAYAFTKLVDFMGDKADQLLSGRSDKEQKEKNRKQDKRQEMWSEHAWSMIGMGSATAEDEEVAKNRGFEDFEGGYKKGNEVLSLSELREMKDTGIDPVLQRSRADVDPVMKATKPEDLADMTAAGLKQKLGELAVIQAQDQDDSSKGKATADQIAELAKILIAQGEIQIALQRKNNTLTEAEKKQYNLLDPVAAH